MKIFRALADEGKSIIFITHKLKEIKEAADRCIVIRAGRVIDDVMVADVAEEKMAEMMVGRKIRTTVDKAEVDQSKAVLEVKGLNVEKHGLKAVKNLDLTVHTGEIVGVAGVDGNGQSELIDALTGMRKIKSGSVKINGKEYANHPVREITETGVGYIPEDRQVVGLVLPMTISENLALKNYYRKPFNNHGILEYADVGAIEYIHEKINDERNDGRAVLLVSFELDEILKLSDRVVVMHAGEIVGEIDPKNTSAEELGLMMAGKKIADAE